MLSLLLELQVVKKQFNKYKKPNSNNLSINCKTAKVYEPFSVERGLTDKKKKRMNLLLLFSMHSFFFSESEYRTGTEQNKKINKKRRHQQN